MLDDEDIVIRYVSRDNVHEVENRLSSGFYKNKNPLSVDVVKLIEDDGNDVREFVLGEIKKRGMAGAIWARVGEIRNADSNLKVNLSTGGSNGPYHADILSSRGNRKMSSKEADILFSLTEWLIGIPGIRVKGNRNN